MSLFESVDLIIMSDHCKSHHSAVLILVICFTIQLYSLLYRKRAKRVQLSHDIVQLVIAQYHAGAHPVTLVVFFQVTEKGFKRLSWIINLLLDVSM